MKRLIFLLLFICAACAGATVHSTENSKDQDVTVSLTVPDLAWRIKIIEIYQVNETLLVISSLSRADTHAAQAIQIVSDSVRIRAPAYKIRHYIMGKKWKWQSKEPYIFINSKDELSGELAGGIRLYP